MQKTIQQKTAIEREVEEFKIWNDERFATMLSNSYGYLDKLSQGEKLLYLSTDCRRPDADSVLSLAFFIATNSSGYNAESPADIDNILHALSSCIDTAYIWKEV